VSGPLKARLSKSSRNFRKRRLPLHTVLVFVIRLTHRHVTQVRNQKYTQTLQDGQVDVARPPVPFTIDMFAPSSAQGDASSGARFDARAFFYGASVASLFLTAMGSKDCPQILS
jgi:hypothetical protein